MIEITIPVEHHSKLDSYIKLSTELKSKLVEQIKSSSLGLTQESFAEYLSETVAIDKNKINDILQVGFSLLNAEEAIGIGLEGFMEILEQALIKTENENLYPTPSVLNDFKSLLSANGANAFGTQKVVELMTEQARVYLDGKITNDIRPVLGNNGTIMGSIMIHQLRLTFKEGEDTKDAYFALDDNDLADLVDKLTQAESQSKFIKDHFQHTTFITIK